MTEFNVHDNPNRRPSKPRVAIDDVMLAAFRDSETGKALAKPIDDVLREVARRPPLGSPPPTSKAAALNEGALLSERVCAVSRKPAG